MVYIVMAHIVMARDRRPSHAAPSAHQRHRWGRGLGLGTADGAWLARERGLAPRLRRGAVAESRQLWRRRLVRREVAEAVAAHAVLQHCNDFFF